MPPNTKQHASAQADSADLVWSDVQEYIEAERIKNKNFRRRMMDSEPQFSFEPYAYAMCALPEADRIGNRDWCRALSPAAEKYLDELDHLHESQPIVSIKIAAIVAATPPVQYVLGKDAAQRINKWLKQDNVSQRARIETGLFILKTWPRKYQQPEGLGEALLEILSKESAVDPQYVRQVTRLRHENLEEPTAYVLSIFDGPEALLTLARNLRDTDPEYTKSIYQTYSVHSRNPTMRAPAPDASLRQVADELFVLETTVPSKNVETTCSVFGHLLKWGPADASWYPIALERLLLLADETIDPTQAAEQYRIVAMNAAPQSLSYPRAMDGFVASADRGVDISVEDSRAIRALAKMLLETGEVACGDRMGFGRNFAAPPNPHHPIVEIATAAFWRFVDRLQCLPSATVLSVLVMAIEDTDLATAEAAAVRVESIFEDMAKRDTDEAAASLNKLARNDWYSDVDALRKARCMKVFKVLLPILEAISADAGKRAKDGLRNPAWDR